MSDEERKMIPSEAPEEPEDLLAAQTPEQLPADEPLSSEAPAETALADLSAPAPAPTNITDDDRLMAALAWFSMVIIQLPLVSIALLLAQGNKERPFQRYHALTSIAFWVVAAIYEALAAIVFTVLTIISLGCLAVCLWVIFFLPHLVCLFYAFQAYSGKEMEIPVLSDFVRKQGWV
ncbi:MAG: DUF4870 domain-containing protein [Chloroflexi bacterium]|nr:DUF4870 domain-containing protein [Chloroflexota bacterium]